MRSHGMASCTARRARLHHGRWLSARAVPTMRLRDDRPGADIDGPLLPPSVSAIQRGRDIRPPPALSAAGGTGARAPPADRSEDWEPTLQRGDGWCRPAAGHTAL